MQASLLMIMLTGGFCAIVPSPDLPTDGTTMVTTQLNGSTTIVASVPHASDTCLDHSPLITVHSTTAAATSYGKPHHPTMDAKGHLSIPFPMSNVSVPKYGTGTAGTGYAKGTGGTGVPRRPTANVTHTTHDVGTKGPSVTTVNVTALLPTHRGHSTSLAGANGTAVRHRPTAHHRASVNRTHTTHDAVTKGPGVTTVTVTVFLPAHHGHNTSLAGATGMSACTKHENSTSSRMVSTAGAGTKPGKTASVSGMSSINPPPFANSTRAASTTGIGTKHANTTSDTSPLTTTPAATTAPVITSYEKMTYNFTVRVNNNVVTAHSAHSLTITR